MNEIDQLWRKRLESFFSETKRYGRYILNDHIKFVLIFGLGAGAFYYQKWLAGISPDFPSAIFAAILIGLLLTYSPIFTFLKEPDLVFLLPLETRLRGFFQKSVLFSYSLQVYLLIFVLAALAPLYFRTAEITGGQYALYGLILLIAKGWNQLLAWYLYYVRDPMMRLGEKTIRTAINVVFVYLLFSQAPWIYIMIMIILMAGFLLYEDFSARQKHTLKWDLLVEAENHRMARFYRLANLFTDVPGMSNRVKPRKWLNGVAASVPYSKETAYRYLYIRSFIRTGEYLGIYFRLAVIGFIAVFAVPYTVGKGIAFLVFLALTAFQIRPLWRHHAAKIWLDLYPIQETFRRKSFLTLLFQLLTLESVLIAPAAFMTLPWVSAAVLLILGLLFSYLFVYQYTEKRISM
ncbi:ABC transporter permease [Bacillus marinisedimentorum]|uniref:ABC transporter permease n=1 Tax=Bacillus marinisedimentorum TaxID=1821260 RepID=UPI0007E1F2C3|nr:ABC transporter permease [Bacillus marinisedimentorum]